MNLNLACWTPAQRSHSTVSAWRPWTLSPRVITQRLSQSLSSKRHPIDSPSPGYQSICWVPLRQLMLITLELSLKSFIIIPPSKNLSIAVPKRLRPFQAQGSALFNLHITPDRPPRHVCRFHLIFLDVNLKIRRMEWSLEARTSSIIQYIHLTKKSALKETPSEMFLRSVWLGCQPALPIPNRAD